MSAITTHVLDTARGRPAGGVPVTLEIRSEEGWKMLGGERTDPDGRARDLSGNEIAAGIYRMTFDTAAYFAACGVDGFYPIVQVVFEVADVSQHHHVPLLLSPFGYSTYRGT
jgi:5-hydroxyisourate hydrolase